MPDAPFPQDPDLFDALRLHLVPGIGPRMMELLLEAFGSPQAILAASYDDLLRVAGIGPQTARELRAAVGSSDAESELARCRELGAQVLRRNGPGYPRLLTEIPDAPAILYCQGTLDPADEMAVAIVGSRRCTFYGLNQAERLAGGLARAGITVVSGLAKGIDAAAHRGALAAGGRTIAVTATGLETVYPDENRPLAEEITKCGAILTEFRLAQKPLPGLFPQRNRIISGLSLGVIVIEASSRSGALHTARHAMEQNRDLFAVPGRIDSRESGGCHDLIRDGAILIRGVDDILSHLGPLLRPVHLPDIQHRADPATPAEPSSFKTREVRSVAELSLSEQERAVLAEISDEPLEIDTLLARCDLAASRILATLTVLEMKRLVRRLPGNRLVRIP